MTTSPDPWTLLTAGSGSMRAVLRRVDARLAEQAARNAAGSLAQQDEARRDQDRTIDELRRLEAPH